jgi:hypothetical protein
MFGHDHIKITIKRTRKNLVDNTKFMTFAKKAVVLNITSTNCVDTYILIRDENDYESWEADCKTELERGRIGHFQFITIPTENVIFVD